jgi:hypothetical protein
MVPWSFPFHDPDHWRGVCRQVTPGPSSGSGSCACQAYSNPFRQSPPRDVEHTFVLGVWQGDAVLGPLTA